MLEIYDTKENLSTCCVFQKKKKRKIAEEVTTAMMVSINQGRNSAYYSEIKEFIDYLRILTIRFLLSILQHCNTEKNRKNKKFCC